MVEYDTATDATVVRNHITYDAFGQITSQTDADYQPRFTFTSRDFDPETGHYYYRARYYDAWMGQFLSEDPIGFAAGDVNYRRYVGNDPLNWVDPSGKAKVFEWPLKEGWFSCQGRRIYECGGG